MLAPRSLRKTIPVCKTGKGLLKDLHLKKEEKEFTSFLSKCSKKREERDLIRSSGFCKGLNDKIRDLETERSLSKA